MDLLIKFEDVKKRARDFKANDIDFWNIIMYQYSENTLINYKWKDIDENFKKYISLLPISSNGVLNEAYYAINQCVRIQEKPISERSLMEIAANIGKVSAMEDSIPPDIMKLFYKLNMEKFYTYISDI